MGLLTTGGAPLRWGSEANNRAVPVVIEHGIQQFLNIYRSKRNLRNCPFIWGEEIESQLVHMDHSKREVRLCLDAAVVLERLRANCADVAVWQPEYGSFMVESTPAQPYTLDTASLSRVEANMHERYHALDAHAGAGTIGITLVTFPLMGVHDFTIAPLSAMAQHATASTTAAVAGAAVAGGTMASEDDGGGGSGQPSRALRTLEATGTSASNYAGGDSDGLAASGGVDGGAVVTGSTRSSGPTAAHATNERLGYAAQPHNVAEASPYSLSLFVPDACINQTHPRFSTLTQNIRLRRGRKVCIQVPLYMDRYTLSATVDVRLNIDAHPRNKDISCGLVGNKRTSSNGVGGGGGGSGGDAVPRRTRRFGDDGNGNGAPTSLPVAAVISVPGHGARGVSDSSARTTRAPPAVGRSGSDERVDGADATATMTMLAPTSADGAASRRDDHDGNAHTGTTDGMRKGTTEAAVSEEEAAAAAAVVVVPELSSATLYYYAQYFTGKQSEYVKARYDSCPCPARWVHQPCVYMDCMAFGMGCNCLQVTMQLADEPEARYAYDQLAILAPVFLAITSATPFQKGLLCDSDVRWLTIAASVDDRQPSEFPRIVKSRYDSISTFIGLDAPALEQFNDTDIAINQSCYDVLRAHDVDARLARHIAHLFIRDPLTIFDQLIDVDDATSSVHFENIQTTNWQSVRFKPPPVGGSIGWRVEFRVMEVMPTPFENAAFALFVALLAAAIVKYRPIFYTRVSVVDENIGRAHRIHPCRELYKMRKNIFCTHNDGDANTYTSSDAEVGQFSVDEIFNGREDGYFGLIPLVRRYVRDVYESEGSEGTGSIPHLDSYLRFISMRASGQIPTTAQYLRQFVQQHTDYRQDSRLTPRIAYDLVNRVHGLANGDVVDDTYLPMHAFRTGKRGREGQMDDASDANHGAIMGAHANQHVHYDAQM